MKFEWYSSFYMPILSRWILNYNSMTYIIEVAKWKGNSRPLFFYWRVVDLVNNFFFAIIFTFRLYLSENKQKFTYVYLKKKIFFSLLNFHLSVFLSLFTQYKWNFYVDLSYRNGIEWELKTWKLLYLKIWCAKKYTNYNEVLL